MFITSGLTTLEEFEDSSFLRGKVRARQYGRGQPPNGTRYISFVNPSVSVINRQTLSSIEEPSRRSCGLHVLPLRAPAVPAETSQPRRGSKAQMSRFRKIRNQRYRPSRSTRYHASLTQLSRSLFERRLDCKRNFQPKCPQNRLRTRKRTRGANLRLGGRLAFLHAGPGPKPPLTRMFCCFLNLLSIGAFSWRIHVIPGQTVRCRQGR